MKKLLFLPILAPLILCAGCLSSMNHQQMVSAGSNLLKAAALDDTQAKAMSIAMRQEEDRQANVAGPDSPYTRRLNNIMSGLTNVNGTPLNYKVYMTNQVNANATPDGSVRVYSGLMDRMNDDELRFVLGHEIGHVANGHSLKRMRMAYVAEAARQGAGSLSPTASALSNSQLGALAKEFVNAQYSQSQENDADAYSMQFLKDHNYNTAAAGSALRKLAAGSSQSIVSAMFSSHPDSLSRADKMDKLALIK